MSNVLSSRRARWAVPASVLVIVGAAIGLAPIVAGASPTLPPKTAAELLAAVGSAQNRPFSGTVVETARLGLPALPETHDGSTSLQSLVTGSHTARLWFAGPDKARFALVGDLAETDVVRNGRDVWVWTSSTNTAQHATLPAGSHDATPAPTPPVSPQEAARRALAAVDPTTVVSVDGSARVAGRPAYELVLQPRDARSLVGQVRIAVDSATSLPLRVEVFAAGASDPAFETGFTSVSFARPHDSVFTFSPPSGAKVEQLSHPARARDKASTTRSKRTGSGPTVIGKGWTAVAVLRGVDLTAVSGNGQRATNRQLDALMRATTPVSGPFGTGKLLRTKLVSVLLLDDGRAFVGAVGPAVLEQVAASAPAGTGAGS